MKHTRPIKLAIAPTKIKVDATRKAVEWANEEIANAAITLIVSDKKSGSGVPEQPIGLQEGRRGAEQRARATLDAEPEATHAIGIENFFEYAGDKAWIDPAAIVILGRDGTRVVVTSEGIPGMIGDVGYALTMGQDKTAGSETARRTGCDGANWHGLYTGGHRDREAILASAAFTALCLVLNGFSC